MIETNTAVCGINKEQPSVLIIDDENSIRKSLEGIFSDEGFKTVLASDGVTALQLLDGFVPSVVLLDIWMPGMDGIELLGRIRQKYPSVPVIMISGHATIATAVKATHMGAVDFIEKPLDMYRTIQAVRKALDCCESASKLGENSSAGACELFDDFPQKTSAEAGDLNRIAFDSPKWKGRKIVQKTLAQGAVLYGQGLHSGKKSGLLLEPLPAGSGIHFVGLSESTAVPAHVDFVGATGFATTLKLGETQAGTTEHLMAALHSYGISNLLIKCNGEVPVMDGSAREFCALFDAIGVVEQKGDWYEIEIKKTIEISKENESIRIEPASAFIVDYTLEYAEPVGRQHYIYAAGSVADFKKEIAPARTFGFVKDIKNLHKAGLALGGRFDNFVLIGEDGAINDNLRFPDEPVRHKVLDVIGDLYLLGRPVRGKVTAKMTGHSDNIALLKRLREEMKAAIE